MGDASTGEEVEQTLLIVRSVDVYKVPPRGSSRGFKCGEWLVSDKLWSGRMRVVAVGGICEVRLEDVNSGELFAMCPVVPGQRDVAVEAAQDSSRYFIIRVQDRAAGRHAFLGLGFEERHTAFDFNVALTDFERQHERETRAASLQAERGTGVDACADGSADAGGAACLRLPSKDYSLKEGETIRVNLSAAQATRSTSVQPVGSGGEVRSISALAPPPGGSLFKTGSTGMPSATPSSTAADPFAELARRSTTMPSDCASTPAVGTTVSAPPPTTDAGWASFTAAEGAAGDDPFASFQSEANVDGTSGSRNGSNWATFD